jgi:acetyl esterase/lipase
VPDLSDLHPDHGSPGVTILGDGPRRIGGEVNHTVVRYGSHHAQRADLRRPESDRDVPVVVLIHGGFWRQLYTKRLMRKAANVVVEHGWAAYNIEYRRVGPLGRGGWPQTFEDVSNAIDALAGFEGIDHRRIVTCGHSAGGHLALWAGSTRSTSTPHRPGIPSVRIRAAISLAGVTDLAAAARLGLGGGAVEALMGASPDTDPDRYALASPASCLPMGIPQILVHGLEDRTVPASLSADYVERARSLGDDAEYVGLPGLGHMDMIDPRGVALREVVTRLDRLFSSPRGE